MTRTGDRLAGRTIAVVGASSGIGAEVVRESAAEGARIILLARREDSLAEVLAGLPAQEHLAFACDCTNELAIEDVRRSLAASKIRLDGLVLSAGAHDLRPLQVARWDHFDAMLRANLATTVIPLRAFSALLQRNRASVVGISSMAAVRAGAGVMAYSAAKGAVESALRVAAIELAPRGIRVNWLRAGVVETPMSSGFMAKLPPGAIEAIQRAHPLGFGKPKDLSALVMFLLSDEAGWITGAAIDIAGGLGIA